MGAPFTVGMCDLAGGAEMETVLHLAASATATSAGPTG